MTQANAEQYIKLADIVSEAKTMKQKNRICAKRLCRKSQFIKVFLKNSSMTSPDIPQWN